MKEKEITRLKKLKEFESKLYNEKIAGRIKEIIIATNTNSTKVNAYLRNLNLFIYNPKINLI